MQPSVSVRRAQAGDHDDIAALLQRCADRCPPLARLPESCRPGEQFALARLIGAQDATKNAVLVAERCGGDGSGGGSGGGGCAPAICGLLAVTAGDADVPLLLRSCDLAPFDGFLDPDVFERLEAQAQAQVQVARGKAGGGTVEEKEQLAGGSGDLDGGGEAVRARLADLAQAALAGCGGSSGGMRRPPSASAAAAARHRLLAVTMLCVDGADGVAEDAAVRALLAAAFAAIPGADYAAIALPHAAAAPAALLRRAVTHLSPAGGPASAAAAALPDVVLIAHRATEALGAFEARLATPEDAAGLSALVSGLPDGPGLFERIVLAQARGGAVVAEAQGQLVAVAVVGEPAVAAAVSSGYGGDKKVPVRYARLKAAIMNPLFEPHAAAFLNAALGLAGGKGAAGLLYASPAGAPLPPAVARCMRQLAPLPEPGGRGGKVSPAPAAEAEQEEKIEEAQDQADDGPLFAFTAGQGPKQMVHTRIVVAGASDTGLACLEALLTGARHRDAAFTHLTLLAPGGVAAAAARRSPSSRFTADRLRRLGLGAAVAVLDASLVGVAAGGEGGGAARLALLDDGRALPFDLLAVTAGLEDPLLGRAAAACPDAAHFLVAPGDAEALFDGPGGGALAQRVGAALVAGGGLEALAAVTAMLAAGVAPAAVRWIRDPSEAQPARRGPSACAYDVLQGMARHAALPPLPGPPEDASLVRAAPAKGGARVLCELEAPGAGGDNGDGGGDGGSSSAATHLEADLIVAACAARALPPAAAAALEAAGCVVDGRAVVGARFEAGGGGGVLAAGPIARFSRRCGAPPPMERCCSLEVGARLADALVEGAAAMAAAGGASDARALPPLLPPPALSRPKILSCRLPGGWAFSCASQPGYLPSLAAPAGSASLLSACGAVGGGDGGKDGSSAVGSGILHLALDASRTIVQVAALAPSTAGSLAALADRLPALVGLPFALLERGGVVLDGGGGGVEVAAGAPSPTMLAVDVAAKLSEPWAEPLLRGGSSGGVDGSLGAAAGEVAVVENGDESGGGGTAEAGAGAEVVLPTGCAVQAGGAADEAGLSAVA